MTSVFTDLTVIINMYYIKYAQHSKTQEPPWAHAMAAQNLGVASDMALVLPGQPLLAHEMLFLTTKSESALNLSKPCRMDWRIYG